MDGLRKGSDIVLVQGVDYYAGYTQFFHKLSLYCTLKLKGLVTTLATLYCKVVNSAI